MKAFLARVGCVLVLLLAPVMLEHYFSFIGLAAMALLLAVGVLLEMAAERLEGTHDSRYI